MTSKFSISCPKCQTRLDIDQHDEGELFNCPACNGLIQLPYQHNGIAGKALGYLQKLQLYYKAARKNKLSLGQSFISVIDNGKHIDFKNDPEFKLLRNIHELKENIKDQLDALNDAADNNLHEMNQHFTRIQEDTSWKFLQSKTVQELQRINGIGPITIEKLENKGITNLHEFMSPGAEKIIRAIKQSKLDEARRDIHTYCRNYAPRLNPEEEGVQKFYVKAANQSQLDNQIQSSYKLHESLVLFCRDHPLISFKHYEYRPIDSAAIEKYEAFYQKSHSRRQQLLAKEVQSAESFEALSQNDYIRAVSWIEERYLSECFRTPFIIDKDGIRNPQDADASVTGKLRGSFTVHDKDLINRIESFLHEEMNDEGMNCSLRHYQAFAAAFSLVQKHVIIGDEMGLGKTIQALACINFLRKQDKHKKFMILVPATLRNNWRHEIQSRLDLQAKIIIGNQHNKDIDQWQKEGGIIIISYTSLARNDYIQELCPACDMLIADEAHYTKNMDAIRSKTVRQLVKKAAYSILMTGTPIENRPEEFFTMINHIPDVNPVFHKENWDTLKEFPEQFAHHAQYLYLRRTRDDVLTELPDCQEIEEWIDPGDDFMDSYPEFLHGRVDNFMTHRNFLSVEQDRLIRVKELIHEAIYDGRKVLFFSFFKNPVEILAAEIPNSRIINGDIPQNLRMTYIEEFSDPKQNINLMLCQIRAAGLGLNLQAASVVIIHEPQLNPALEHQAIARAYRMGQRNKVTVYRLYLEDSFETEIYKMLQKKKKYFEDFADDSLLKESSPAAIAAGDLNKAYEQYKHKAS